MKNKPTVLGLVTARGGSKRLPGKNVRPLNGKPLIAWTLEAALGSKLVERVMVSTDDDEIAQVTRQFGAEVPFMRPVALAQDDTPHLAVIDHALAWLKEEGRILPDYLLILQPTSPLRSTEDIDQAVQIAVEKNADSVVGVCSHDRNPTFLWQLSAEGKLAEVPQFNPIFYTKPRPKNLLAPNGAIYLIRVETFLREKNLYPKNSYPYIMPAERSIDVDTETDFRIAELLAVAVPKGIHG